MIITDVVVMTHTGSTDRVVVYTNLPSPFPPEVSTNTVQMTFEVQNHKGLEYALANFISPDIWTLDVRTGEKVLVRGGVES